MRKKKMPPVIHKLRAWRSENGNLSARQSAIVMLERGFTVSHRTIESWENGARAPSRFAAQALEKFLGEYPKITGAPKYQRYKISEEQVLSIRAARANGDSILKIAERFNISQSSVSRISRGERRKIA